MFKYKVGDFVWAKYQDKWFEAEIEKLEEGGTYTVYYHEYDDSQPGQPLHLIKDYTDGEKEPPPDGPNQFVFDSLPGMGDGPYVEEVEEDGENDSDNESEEADGEARPVRVSLLANHLPGLSLEEGNEEDGPESSSNELSSSSSSSSSSNDEDSSEDSDGNADERNDGVGPLGRHLARTSFRRRFFPSASSSDLLRTHLATRSNQLPIRKTSSVASGLTTGQRGPLQRKLSAHGKALLFHHLEMATETKTTGRLPEKAEADEAANAPKKRPQRPKKPTVPDDIGKLGRSTVASEHHQDADSATGLLVELENHKRHAREQWSEALLAAKVEWTARDKVTVPDDIGNLGRRTVVSEHYQDDLSCEKGKYSSRHIRRETSAVLSRAREEWEARESKETMPANIGNLAARTVATRHREDDDDAPATESMMYDARHGREQASASLAMAKQLWEARGNKRTVPRASANLNRGTVASDHRHDDITAATELIGRSNRASRNEASQALSMAKEEWVARNQAYTIPLDIGHLGASTVASEHHSDGVATTKEQSLYNETHGRREASEAHSRAKEEWEARNSQYTVPQDIGSLAAGTTASRHHGDRSRSSAETIDYNQRPGRRVASDVLSAARDAWEERDTSMATVPDDLGHLAQPTASSRKRLEDRRRALAEAKAEAESQNMLAKLYAVEASEKTATTTEEELALAKQTWDRRMERRSDITATKPVDIGHLGAATMSSQHRRDQTFSTEEQIEKNQRYGRRQTSKALSVEKEKWEARNQAYTVALDVGHLGASTVASKHRHDETTSSQELSTYNQTHGRREASKALSRAREEWEARDSQYTVPVDIGSLASRTVANSAQRVIPDAEAIASSKLHGRSETSQALSKAREEWEAREKYTEPMDIGRLGAPTKGAERRNDKSTYDNTSGAEMAVYSNVHARKMTSTALSDAREEWELRDKTTIPDDIGHLATQTASHMQRQKNRAIGVENTPEKELESHFMQRKREMISKDSQEQRAAWERRQELDQLHTTPIHHFNAGRATVSQQSPGYTPDTERVTKESIHGRSLLSERLAKEKSKWVAKQNSRASGRLQQKEKMAEEAMRLFESIDAEKRGSLKLKDLETASPRLKMSSTEAAKVFKDLDKDGDGTVSVKEFFKGFIDLKKRLTGARKEKYETRVEHDQKAARKGRDSLSAGLTDSKTEWQRRQRTSLRPARSRSPMPGAARPASPRASPRANLRTSQRVTTSYEPEEKIISPTSLLRKRVDERKKRLSTSVDL